MEYRIENGWVIDENNNKASVNYWGGEKAAKDSLGTLEDCKDCRNCSDCSDCSGCSDCSRCSGCSDCSDCSGCSGCSDCSDCSDCSGCSRCSDCSGCSRCSDCSGCSGCSGCSDCSGCSRCSDCSGCSGCSGLKNARVSFADLMKTSVEDIHQKVFEAASDKDALDMKSWHTCDTTHCRAGWVVTLAGDLGKSLERATSTEFAAKIIYKNSSPITVSPTRFYETSEQALADMKRCAELEKAQN